VPKVVKAVVEDDPALGPLFAQNPDVAQWCKGLKSFAFASQRSRFLPFLSAVGLALDPLSADQRYAHLVIDEAQDLRPLEWAILSGYVVDDRNMSLFGDMHQRRSDWGPDSWHRVAVDREWTDDEGNFEPEKLEVGFRTTKEILDFANQLLPQGERFTHSLRRGEAPEDVRAGSQKDLAAQTVATAERLVVRFRPGLVAIITVDPAPIAAELKRVGWKQSPGDPDGWFLEGKSLGLLTPEDARGLEFDGVVVVEPSDFPENIGRNGTLYTSLTRAVHKLVITRARPLPKTLSISK